MASKAKECGVELLVLDDGWFGERRNDWTGLGDWTAAKSILPDGIAGLTRRIEDMGMMFGLWFEPEMVNEDGDELMRIGLVTSDIFHSDNHLFARLQFKGKNIMFSLVLFQMMIPTQIFIIPQYLMVSKMGMTNTIFALVFPGIVTAFGTFLMRQAYMGFPASLEEAARLDGCNIFQTFMYIMSPLTRSSMVALGIFTAVFAYKDLMWPLVVNSSSTKMPLSAALATMQGQYQSNYPQLMAASLIACIPMIVLYLIFQKQFIEGIATSGGKL